MKDQYNRNINYLRLSVTDRCNLRCRYCMPRDCSFEEDDRKLLTESEMVQAVEAAASLGITKVRLTGGEPLVKKNILSLCGKIHEIPGIQTLCLTTNGIFLPSMAQELKKLGVTGVNISLDTLREDRYGFLTGGGSLREALRGIEAAFDAGFDKVKLNAVLLGGINEDEVPALAALTKEYPVDVRFIEWMPMKDGGDFDERTVFSAECAKERLEQAEGPLIALPDELGVAKLYRIPKARGRVGFITPMSSHFCGSCNRIRITADGKILPCLHGSQEFAIKGLGLEEMKEQLEAAIVSKPKAHEILSPSRRSPSKRSMNRIGG